MDNVRYHRVVPFPSIHSPSTMFLCLYGSLPASITPKFTGLRGLLCEIEQCPSGCLEPRGCSTWPKLQHSGILLLCSVMYHVVVEGTWVLELGRIRFSSWLWNFLLSRPEFHLSIKWGLICKFSTVMKTDLEQGQAISFKQASWVIGMKSFQIFLRNRRLNCGYKIPKPGSFVYHELIFENYLDQGLLLSPVCLLEKERSSFFFLLEPLGVNDKKLE